MTTEAVVVTVVASLLSGLVGVFVSSSFYQRLERRKMKMETARKLFGSKHNMSRNEFQEAMNEVMVVFSDSHPVIAAMDGLWTTLEIPVDKRAPSAAQDKLIKFMKTICDDIGIRYGDLPDAYFLRVFSVPKEQPGSATR